MKKAIILFEGRCGSSHLSSLLDQSPFGTFLGEVLSDLNPKGWSAQIEFINNFFSENSHSDLTEYVGLKTKLRAVDEDHIEEFAQTLAEKNIAVIRLHRRDILRQSISSLRADRLVTEKGIYNIEKKSNLALGPINLEPRGLANRAKFIVDEELRIDKFLMSYPNVGPRMIMAYEDLLADRNAALKEIYEFLGVKEFYPKEDIYSKMTSEDLEESVKNHDAVIRATRGCKFLTI